MWWYQFIYSASRYQESGKSTRKTIGQAAEKRRHLELEQVYASIPATEPGRRVSSASAALKAKLTPKDGE